MNRSRVISVIRRGLPWLAFAIGVLWLTRGARPGAHFPVGSQLPPFTAQLSDGSSFTLGPSLPQVVVLTFWASYCVPCRAEAPVLSAIQSPDIRVLGLSVEDLPATQVAAQARALGMRYPVGNAAPSLLTRFRVGAVPTTYVIARDGTVVLSRVGAVSSNELREALASARRRAG